MNHLKVSKDIQSIIYKYIDYSLSNLNKTCIKNVHIIIIKFKKDITLTDIITKCTLIGYRGFYFCKSFPLQNTIIEMNKKEKLNLINENDRLNNYWFIKSSIKKVTDISLLNVLDISFKKKSSQRK